MLRSRGLHYSRMAGKGSAIDDESQVGKITAILIAGSVISLCVVLLRCFTRTRILQLFSYEDVFIVCAQVMIITEAILIGLGTFDLQTEKEWKEIMLTDNLPNH